VVVGKFAVQCYDWPLQNIDPLFENVIKYEVNIELAEGFCLSLGNLFRGILFTC